MVTSQTAAPQDTAPAAPEATSPGRPTWGAAAGAAAAEAEEEEEEETKISSDDAGSDEEWSAARRKEVQGALMKRFIPEAMQELWAGLRRFDRERLSRIFEEPVNRSHFPDYDSVISAPMDIRTLGKKLKGFPATMEGLRMLKEDVLLMAGNAVRFSQTQNDPDLKQAADSLQHAFLQSYNSKVKQLESEIFLPRHR